MGRGVKGAAGAFRAGGKVRRGRQASVVGLAALVFLYGFSLFKTFAHRAGVLNYNPPALRVVIIVIRKNHLSAL